MPNKLPNGFLLKRSRELRRKMTLPEKILWQFLRASCFAGLHFRRQHPIGSYIADFCCIKAKLIVELDGRHHDQIKHDDEKRDDFFKKRGFRVLRFTNDHVFDHIDWLLQTIAHELEIDWKKSYHDCVACVKYPQRLHTLFAGIEKFKKRNGNL